MFEQEAPDPWINQISVIHDRLHTARTAQSADLLLRAAPGGMRRYRWVDLMSRFKIGRQLRKQTEVAPFVSAAF